MRGLLLSSLACLDEEYVVGQYLKDDAGKMALCSDSAKFF